MNSVLTLIHLLYLLLYFVIAAQAVFYLLCFAEVFSRIPSSHFILIRKIADPILDLPMKFVYYGSLILGCSFIFVSFYTGSSLYQFASMAVFVLLIGDVILVKRKSVPLNTRIRFAEDIRSEEGAELQAQWIRWIRIRGVIGLTGFTVLLLIAVLT